MTTHALSAKFFLTVLGGWWLVGWCFAEEPKKGFMPSLTSLSLEVAAMETLHDFKLTGPQVEVLRKLAMETAPKDQSRRPGKGSEKLRKALTSLHQALVENKDDDRVNQLADQVDELRETENPDLDDGIEISEEARRRAPEIFQLLSARQVAGYLAAVSGNIADPRERLMEALEKVRGLSQDQWKDFRDEIADEIGPLVAGLDEEKAERVGDEAVQLLIMARGMKDPEFKKQKRELEEKARKIVGNIGSMEVLQNVMEHSLAGLLSNPQLEAAIEVMRK